MVTVVDVGTGWVVRVDGVIRGRGIDVFDAVLIARRWGF